MKFSRRHLIRMGAAVASARAATAQSPSHDAAEAGLTPLNLNPNRRILLKGGTIISMDASVGDFVQGDILIQGKKIAAVGANVKVSGPGPQVVEASNTILIPGFVDCHRHSWEGVLRRIIPNGDIAKYMATTHQGFAPLLPPARHVRRQSDHRPRLHRRRDHLHHRQFAQFPLGRAFRRGRSSIVRSESAPCTPPALRKQGRGITSGRRIWNVCRSAFLLPTTS